jgi:hypothetical protein
MWLKSSRRFGGLGGLVGGSGVVKDLGGVAGSSGVMRGLGLVEEV